MKNRVAIFARVSTDHQSYERQIADLTQYAKSRNLEVIEIITEKISGAKDNSEREGIIQLRALANQGKFDRILVTELSRLGRNAYQVATLIHEFTELGISIIVQSLGVETLSDEGKANPLIDLLIAVVNQFSSMERTFLIDRINSGLDRARANGKTLGRPKGTTTEERELIRKYKSLAKDLQSKISVRKAAKIHGVSTTTVQKVKKAIVAFA